MGKNYSIRKYTLSWRRRFQKQRRLVKKVFGASALEVHHVGSTSVPGMKAKPVIDVLVIVRNLRAIDKLKTKFKNLGYRLRVNTIAPNSRLLEKFSGNTKFYNIHFLPKTHPEAKRLLTVKKYLLEHPNEIKTYENLKNKLYKQHPHNYSAYRKGKTKYLNILQKKANRWILKTK